MGIKTFGDYKYEVTDNKEITILKYMGEAEEVTIPDSIEDMPVTEIGRRAFDGCRSLEKITLPEGLKTINWGAFDSCVSLQSVILPESVTYIGEGAFKNCSSLKNIELPSGLERVTFDAFADCTALESISIPNGVKRIERRTFMGCKALTSIFIPASVKRIYLCAFEGCESLENIVVEESNPAYSFFDGALREKNNNRRLYTTRAALLRNADVITNANELEGKSDKEILGLISEALGIDYEIKSEIWEYGFCGDGPLFEVAFENENVVQLGSTKMTVKTLELCAALQSLEVLNICYSDADIFPKSLCSLSKLRLLNLHGTNIEILPNDIGRLAALEELHFGGTEISVLPDTVCCLSQLKKLRAQHSGLKRLPKDIGNLKNLEILDIHHSCVNELPESLADCTRLDSLWWRFNESNPQIPEAVTANIMANFGTTSEMSPFARFRNHSHNNEFVAQIVMADHKLVQIWNDFEQLAEVDNNSILGFCGAYVNICDNGVRRLIDEAVASFSSCPLYDDEELSPASLGSSIFSSMYVSSFSEITKEEMESWIPQIYEFYSMDDNHKKDYPAFFEEWKEELNRRQGYYEKIGTGSY